MKITSSFPRPKAALTWIFLAAACFWVSLPTPFLAVGSGDEGAAKKEDASEPPEKKAQDDKPASKDDAKKEEKKEADAAEDKKDAVEKDADTPKTDEAKKPVRNPLTDLIKRSLGKQPAGEAAGIPLPQAADAPKKNPNRHTSDPRAPYDKRADDWMRKAQAHAKAGEWKSALELLQRISELPEDTLYRTEDKKWTSLHSAAQRLRGEAPAELLDEYRVQFGGLARQLLNDALRSGDVEGFGRVATIYFHTDAGYEAANRLGSLHLDRGEFAVAARWFAALWQSHAGMTKDVLWRAKAAYALKQAGQAELSRQVFDDSLASATASTGLAGRSREPGKWLASAPRVAAADEPPLSDWPLFFGTPRRTGTTQGGEPLLLPRWRLATTDSHPVQSQIEHLLEDLADQSTTSLPMLFPTLVAGKIVFRTLHGVQVIDAATGRPLWQTDEPQSLERMLAGTAGQFQTDVNGGFFPGIVMARAGRWNNGGFFGGGNGEHSPLCNLLFRNANFGIVSSDGSRLFVVDDPQFLSNRQPANPFGFDPSANSLAIAPGRLSAYDLETGHPLWEIGGPANGEPFDLPLAGYFFFGAPVVDGGELFVVGESTAGDSSGQIRLICLDPRTGEKKWTQLIAASEVSIEKDIGRRWWTAQVAAADGILLCPSTVGWLVAVDRVTRTLLWGYRTPQQGQPNNNQAAFGQNEAMNMVQPTPLGATWSAAPPVIADGRIIYTPQDAQVLVCLDEFTGKELWTKPRGNALYLAGVFEGLVVVVGRDAVVAYRLENGSQAWSTPISPPSGRGVTVADRLYLPLAAGEVWSIALKTGSVASKWNLPGYVPAVGNLAMYRGMLLSVDAHGLTAFEQRDAVQSEIDRRKKDNPRDPWAMVREAEISLLARNVPEALASLRRVVREDVPGELRETFRSLLVRVLTATIRADFSSPETDANLNDLANVVSSADEKQSLQRLRAELFVARSEYEQAFEAYLALADNRQELVPRDDVPGLKVRGDLWVAGKLADLEASLPAEARPAIARRVAELRAQSEASEEARIRFLTLFRAHPEAVVVRRQLAESYANRGEFLKAEHLLLKLARGSDAAGAAEATLRLAQLMIAFKLPADAAYYYHELEHRLGAEKLPDGRTGREIVQALRDAGNLPDAPPPVLDWHADAVRIDRMGANYVNHVPQELTPIGSPLPFFLTHRFEVEPVAQRLEVIDGLTDDLHWSLPLRNKAGSAEGGLAIARAAGHRLTLLQRGVIHSLSPVDRKVLWTRPLENRGAGQQSFGRNQSPLQPMQQAVSLMNRHAAAFQGMPGAPGSTLGLANHEFVSYQGRRSMTVLDAVTGEVCWVYAGVRPSTHTLGGDEVIYLRPTDGQNPLALRASDGKRLEVKNLPETLNRAIHDVGDNFVLSGLPESKLGLRLFDPVAQRDLWTVPLAKGAVMAVLDNDRLAVLEQAEGKLAVIDLTSGERRDMATIAPEDFKGKTEFYVLSDNTHIYLLINKGQVQNYYSEQVPFVRASGLVLAFDAESGKQRWKQTVQAQNLMLERLTFSPFLVFSSRKFEQKGNLNFWSLHLLAIDKFSGTKLLDERSAAQPGFRSVTVNAAERYVELRSYNERLRLYPVEKSASAGQSGGQ